MTGERRGIESVVAMRALVLIPTEPSWQPELVDAASARELAEDLLAPEGPTTADFCDEVEALLADDLAVFCPNCERQADQAWWEESLADAEALNYRALAVMLPCCGKRGDLNQLDFRPASGFARFKITAHDPTDEMPGPEEIATIAAALEHPIRVVRLGTAG